MKLKTILLATILLLMPAMTALAQNDGGAPDSLIMEFTPPEMGANDSTFQLRLYMFNDSDNVASMSGGFDWDNSSAQMDTAFWSPQADAAFNFIKFLFFGGDKAQTNTQQKFQAAGSRIFGNGIVASPSRKLIATYDFRVTNWTLNSVIIVDTNVFSGGTNLKFVNTSNKDYIPYWNGPLEIRDPNAPTNADPVLDPIGAKSVDEGVNLNFTVTATDADSNPLTLTASPLPTGATFTDNGDGSGTFDWTPGFAQSGPFDIKFKVSDGTASDSEMVTITVNNVNRAPVLATIGAKSVDVGVTLSFNVSATDPDGSIPSLSATPLPAGATFTDNTDGTGSFSWTPTSAQVGDAIVTFSATDGMLSGSEPVTITVNPPANQPPVLATIGAQSTTEGVQLAFTVSATDPEGAALTLFTDSLPMGATFIDNGDGTGAFDWTPGFSQAGVYQIPFYASDGSLSDTEVVTITVNDGGNQAPVLGAIGSKSTDENARLFFNVSASDPDGTISSLSTSTLPSGATFVDNGNGGGSFDWTPDFTQSGTYNITFMASDGSLNDSEVVTITVNDVNRNPVIDTIPDQSVVTGEQLLFTVSANDPDGTIPALSADPIPTGATFTDNSDGTGSFDWTPGASQTGSFNVTFFANDGLGGFDSTVANIVVLRPPSADSVWVGNTPAVPGASVSVPVSFNNSCSLEGAFLALTYDSVYLYLDSVAFGNGALVDWDNQVDMSIPGWIMITSAMSTAPSIPQGSGSLWADLYFTARPETPAGIYPINLNTIITRPPVSFDRNCGAGVLAEIPEFFAGSIISDTSSNFVCGYVVRPDGTEIVDATVELYADFPNGTAIQTTSSSGIGSWSFSDFTEIPFDIYAYAEGYYPADVQDLNFGERGVRLVLEPLPTLTPTSQWVDYYSDSSTYFGAPLPVGSVVEARTPAPANLLVGQFMVTLAGQYGFMPVYRASTQFSDPGAVEDDVISFFINGDKAIAIGNVIFPSAANTPNGISVNLEGGAVVTKTCDLVEDWNLVSWNIDTQSDAILDVLGSQMSCIEVVLGFEAGGLTYDPLLPDFSTLSNVDHLSGYWVKVKTGCTVSLAIEGVPVPSTTPIPVSAGWNLVSYLPELNLTPINGFNSLGADLLYAYGYDNGIIIYQPGAGGFNTLTDLSTCNGYWIKMGASGTLVYSGSDSVSGLPTFQSNPLALASSTVPVNPIATPNWVNLYAGNLNLDGKTVREGTVITAKSVSSDEIIGNFTMTRDGKFGFMPVYASVNENNENGFRSGDNFYLSVGDVKTSERFTWSANGESIEITSLSSASSSVNGLPDSYSLSQNYPNPFNPSTVISFSLPSAGQARVEIFNLLGELIAVPFDGQALAGESQIEWNGRDRAGRTVASGVYFYRLTSGSFTEARKMMLLK